MVAPPLGGSFLATGSAFLFLGVPQVVPHLFPVALQRGRVVALPLPWATDRAILSRQLVYAERKQEAAKDGKQDLFVLGHPPKIRRADQAGLSLPPHPPHEPTP